MNKETGGPAFPFDQLNPHSEQGRALDWQSEGMTLRDYFAARAMAAFAADAKRGPDTVYMNYGIAAREAYLIADAMLAERAK